jgi:hypothetical protein
MLLKLATALLLMALCVTIHAAGLTWALLRIQGHADRHSRSLVDVTGLLIVVAAWCIVLHLAQIVIWAIFYLWHKGMPDLPSAIYFSAVTYTTTGYGDLVLPQEWRLVGGVEALTGILMCGLSTGFFFAIFTRAIELTAPRERP